MQEHCDYFSIIPPNPPSLADLFETSRNAAIDLCSHDITNFVHDGMGYDSLATSGLEFVTSDRHVCVMGAHIGLRKTQQDRVAINGTSNMFAAIDGYDTFGHVAADTLGKSIAEATQIYQGVVGAIARMPEMSNQPHAACFSAVQIVENQLKIIQAGDTKIIVIGRDGCVRMVSKDKDMPQMWEKYGYIDTDEALYIPGSHIVLSSIHGESNAREFQESTIGLISGDTIIQYSDGITLTPEEIAWIICEMNSEGKQQVVNPAEAFRRIATKAMSRQRNWEEIMDATLQRAKRRYPDFDARYQEFQKGKLTTLINNIGGRNSEMMRDQYTKHIFARRLVGEFSDGMKMDPVCDNVSLLVTRYNDQS